MRFLAMKLTLSCCWEVKQVKPKRNHPSQEGGDHLAALLLGKLQAFSLRPSYQLASSGDQNTCSVDTLSWYSGCGWNVFWEWSWLHFRVTWDLHKLVGQVKSLLRFWGLLLCYSSCFPFLSLLETCLSLLLFYFLVAVLIYCLLSFPPLYLYHYDAHPRVFL